MSCLSSRFSSPFSFESQEMKKSYYLFNARVEKKLLGLFQIIVTLTFTVLSIVGFVINSDLRYSLIRVGLIVLSVFIFTIRKWGPRIYKIAMMILAAGLSLYIIIYMIRIRQINIIHSFLSGNTIGMFEIMIALSFKTLQYRTVTYSMLLFIKVACLYDDLAIQPRIYIQFFIFSLQVFVFCMYHDLLERKNFGLIFKATEKTKKFQDLLSNDLPSSVMIMTSNFSKILYSNKFFQQQFSPNETMENAGKIINDLFGKLILEEEQKDNQLQPSQQETSLLDYLIEMSTRNPENQEKVRILYASHKNRDGAEFHYEVRLRRILWDNQHSYAIVMNDITDKQLVTSLKIADTQKDRILATVSHELRTPINGILGLLDMSSELTNDDTLLKYLENCKSCSKLLLYLVNSILDLSQVRNKSLRILKEAFNLSDILEELNSLYIFVCKQKGIKFIIEKDPNIDEEVYTDKYRLVEVLINLLGNAIKFTYTGFVKLKISKSDLKNSTLVFSVEDTGLGIKEEDISKLFKMFGKLDQADKNINTHGVGLGLTIANELVKALNNHDQKENIMLESEINKGSRFWFQVDISEPKETDSIIEADNVDLDMFSEGVTLRDFAEFSTPAHTVSGKLKLNRQNPFYFGSNSTCISSKRETLISPKTSSNSDRGEILLIDDSPLNLMAASFILEKLNFSVTKALNGQEGIKLLEESIQKQKLFCLIVTDIQMPVMDGLEMSKQIKEKIKKKEIYSVPIVALTAKKLDQKEIEKHKECGIDWSLEKPLAKSEIEKVINALVK